MTHVPDTGPVTLDRADALFIADVLHLAGRLLRHDHAAELRTSAASLADQAAMRLPPGSRWTITDH
ncbi:hypothetical protein KGQ19_48445, partial [Catenulispora sp. NL8]